MKDRYMFKIALATSIIGIVGMMIFAGQITPKHPNINEINPGMLDEEITIEGVVDNIKESPKSQTYFLDVTDNTGKISVVIFKRNAKDIENNNLTIFHLNKKRIKILGTVTEYNGRMELILKDAKSLEIIA